MTNQPPKEFWIYGTYVDTEPLENMDGVHVIEAGPVLEKIKRLEEQIDELKKEKLLKGYVHTNGHTIVDTLRLAEERDSLKAQVDELSGHSLAQADEIKQLKIYLTNYQNDMIEKNKQLEIAVKALEFYEYPWTEYQYKNFLKDQGDRARQALAQIQKMRGGE